MEENQGTTSEQQQKSTSPMLVIGIVVVIAIIAGVFWLTSNNSTKTTQTDQAQTQTESEQTTVTEQPSDAATEGTADDSTSQAITVEGGNFFFKPNEIRVKKGEKVTVTFTNSGGMHNFVIDEFDVKSETINGGSTKVEFTADKAGTFEFYCSIGNHKQMGMKGNLIVE